jgi:2-polyprenyl-3-methyl-5-hydroxy-6-metoxy-1,4-benzoquinol methylase
MTSYLADDYATKREDYFTAARADYVAELPADPGAAILELGCSNGATGMLALAQGKCATYVGIEMFEPAAADARKVLTAVHVGDVATLDLPYPPGTFDALICSEVLEHLVDPEPVLRKLVALLKPGGMVYASSPNVSHWRIIAGLIRGRFEYSDFGAMDTTHLRWFTPRSYRALFEAAGVEVTRVKRLAPVAGIKKLLLGLLGRRFGHLLWYQIDLRGRRRPNASGDQPE